MSCPYFKEGYFGICVAPDAIHVPGLAEMESFCFRDDHHACPNFSVVEKSRDTERISHASEESKSPGRAKANLHLAS
jgi:hypothetical protein